MYTFFGICGALILTSLAVFAACMAVLEVRDRCLDWYRKRIDEAFHDGRRDAQRKSEQIIEDVRLRVDPKECAILKVVASKVGMGIYVQQDEIDAWAEKWQKKQAENS